MNNCQLCDSPLDDQDRGYVTLQRFSPAGADECSTIKKRVCGNCLDAAASLLITMTGASTRSYCDRCKGPCKSEDFHLGDDGGYLA